MPLLRSVFLAVSHARPMRALAERSRLGLRLSARFIAGLEVEDALRVAAELNAAGMAATLDSLGESVTSEAEARRAAEVYHRLLEAIAERKLKANVSLKLTQMGLDLSPALAEQIVGELAGRAARLGGFIRVDMEDSPATEATLGIVRRLHARAELREAIGVVIQAYLYRSEADLEHLLAEGVRVRLCKGAYLEPAAVAFQRKSDVDANYVKLVRRLLASGLYHGLATHDEAMIAAAKSCAGELGLTPDRFEFQMLYGVRRGLQERLVREGYRVRVYAPFGRQWYPYFMRRLAERPANLLFLVKSLFRS
jgi:proline dehydrogenase